MVFAALQPQPDLRLEIDLANDGTHVISIHLPSDLTGPAHAIRCDGIGVSLGGFIDRGRRVALFEIAGHPATMTLTVVWPTSGIRVRRALARETVVMWAVYGLTVDGVSRGAYVARVAGVFESWTPVKPDDPLPDGTNEWWPAVGQ